MSFSSPFSPWLGTNYTPSTSEVSQISAFLEEPRNELVALNDEVDQALRALNSLLAKQAKLKRHIEAHEALIHPIRRLPDELLVEIFHHCLPTSHRPVMSNASAPLILTHICHPWRSLVLSTQTLWSSLHIPIPKGWDETHHIAITNARDEGVRWWLANAKDAPLSISLYWPPALLYAYDTECQLLRTVLEHSSRIRVLELDLPDSVLLEVFFHDDPQYLPTLEKVVLRLPAPPDRRTRGLQISHAHLWKSPSINSLLWESVDDDFFRLPLDWGRMKEIMIYADPMIHLSYISPLDARALINATPNLRRLRLELTIYDQSRSRLPDSFPRMDSEFITMNHLTHLDLTDVSLDPDMETSFLQNLQLPVLTSLTYNFMGLNPFLSSLSGRCPAISSPTHPLLAFLQAQNTVKVRYFKVGATSIPRDAFLECLRLMPLLEKLYVTDPRLLSDEDDDYDEYEVDVREPVSDEEGPDGMGFLSLDELLAAHEAQHLLDHTDISAVEGYHSLSERKRSRRRLEDEERYERLRANAARQREIHPDDDLLKTFVPSEVWWKTAWDDIAQRQSKNKGKGREKETAMDVADSVYGDVAWWGSPMVTGSRTGGASEQTDDDIDMFSDGDDQAPTNVEAISTPPPETTSHTPPTARPFEVDPAFVPESQSDSLSLRGLPLLSDPREPALPEPLEDEDVLKALEPDTATEPPRIPVPIPVDTTDLAAEEQEILCPRLTSLRFDRTRFSVTVLRTFIKARMALSRSNGAVPGWQAVGKDVSSATRDESLDGGRAEADAESAGFFTARTSPSGASSRIGLSREPSTSTSGASATPEPVPQTNQGLTVAAALQHVHAGIVHGQPTLDVPPPRAGRKDTSRLSAEMSEEFDVRVTLRFASTPTLDSSALRRVWGIEDDSNSERANTGTPRWRDGRTVGLNDEGVFDQAWANDGRGAGGSRARDVQRRAGAVGGVNDARVGVRGWRGPGSVYEEQEDAEVWEW